MIGYIFGFSNIQIDCIFECNDFFSVLIFDIEDIGWSTWPYTLKDRVFCLNKGNGRIWTERPYTLQLTISKLRLEREYTEIVVKISLDH